MGTSRAGPAPAHVGYLDWSSTQSINHYSNIHPEYCLLTSTGVLYVQRDLLYV